MPLRFPLRFATTALVATTFSGVALVARPARAIEPELSSDSAAQLYDVRSPTGQTVLDRTRFTTTLGLNLYDILGEHSVQRNGPELDFRARVRYDADYVRPRFRLHRLPEASPLQDQGA